MNPGGRDRPAVHETNLFILPRTAPPERYRDGAQVFLHER